MSLPGAAKLWVENLDVAYETAGGPYLAVQGVSFHVQAGEKLVILGPSGCGKSTLLKAVAGFLRPTQGRILVGERAVQGPGPDRVVVFQEFDQLLPWRTVKGNITYALRATGRASGQAASRRADEVLELVGLSSFHSFYPHTLSGGMKQRAAIARALALDPEILLLDEPFAALDALSRNSLQAEVNRLHRETGKTMLLVTHSIEEAMILGSRIIVMTPAPGRIRQIFPNRWHGEGALENPEGAALYHEIRDLVMEGATDPRTNTGGAA